LITKSVISNMTKHKALSYVCPYVLYKFIDTVRGRPFDSEKGAGLASAFSLFPGGPGLTLRGSETDLCPNGVPHRPLIKERPAPHPRGAPRSLVSGSENGVGNGPCGGSRPTELQGRPNTPSVGWPPGPYFCVRYLALNRRGCFMCMLFIGLPCVCVCL
jgi:hypothetical protein